MGVYKVSGKAEIDLTKMYEYGIEAIGLKQAQTYLSGNTYSFSSISR